MAFRANPQANPWLLDEIEQLRILDILCLENDTVCEVACGYGTAGSIENGGSSLGPESY